jgi:predicted transcriptional regulator
MMTALTIELPPDRMQQLVEVAERLGVTPEALVRASVDDLLARSDDAFERAAERVLAKNAELYRRLA